jgi:hypothetical protein
MPKSSFYKDATPADAKTLADVYKLCSTLSATGKYPVAPAATSKPVLLLSMADSIRRFININF